MARTVAITKLPFVNDVVRAVEQGKKLLSQCYHQSPVETYVLSRPCVDMCATTKSSIAGLENFAVMNFSPFSQLVSNREN